MEGKRQDGSCVAPNDGILASRSRRLLILATGPADCGLDCATAGDPGAAAGAPNPPGVTGAPPNPDAAGCEAGC